MIRVFKRVSAHGDKTEYWATDDINMGKEKSEDLSGASWGNRRVPSRSQAMLWN